MNKYRNACVYKIYNKLNPEEFYIGSTIQSLTARFQHHKRSDMKRYTSLYKVMLEKGFDNFEIELVCCYENCESRTELIKLEQEVIDELKPTINKCRAYSSKEYNIKYNRERNYHYRIDNKEKINKYFSQYRIDNKEKISEKGKIKFICECGNELRKDGKAKHERSKYHQDFIKNLI